MNRRSGVWLACLGLAVAATGVGAQVGGGFDPFSPAGPGAGGGLPFGGGTFFGPGVPGGPGLPGGPGGGTQGGFGINAIDQILFPNQTVFVAAYCTDLFLAAPDHKTLYVPPVDAGTVRLASGEELTATDAVNAGLLVARGPRPLERLPRDGWGALRIVWVNTARQPLHLRLRAGTLVSPRGEPPRDASYLPGVVAVARQLGIGASQVTQFAIWAARGATREDIEQTRLVPITDEEAAAVQRLLTAAGSGQRFDRGAGEYARLYQAAERLAGERPLPVRGTALLNDGTHVRIAGIRDSYGKAILALTPSKGPARTYYTGALLTRRQDGRWRARLVHLKTGGPHSGNGGEILFVPEAADAPAPKPSATTPPVGGEAPLVR